MEFSFCSGNLVVMICLIRFYIFFQCMDFGFHQSVHRAIMMHSDAINNVKKSLQQDIYGLEKSLNGLDSRLDKQRFFESNNSAFMIPKKFDYNPVRRDETETLTQKTVLEELGSRKGKLQERLTSLKTESEEIWKSMELAEKSLSEVVKTSSSLKNMYSMKSSCAISHFWAPKFLAFLKRKKKSPPRLRFCKLNGLVVQ